MRILFALFFVSTSVLAIASMPRYEEAGVVVFENPADVSNSFVYFLIVLAFTAFVLLSVRFKRILTLILQFITVLAIYYVLSPFIGVLAILIALLIILILEFKPNMLIINVAAIMLAAGITSIFGISLEPIPAIVLLVILAVYDAIAVYKTKHMINLAESVKDLKVPMLFVAPKNAYMGVGDAVIPNILAVSAQRFTKSQVFLFLKVSALLTLVGGLIGLLILLYIVERKGGAHPGLPFVNTGAIIGFLVSSTISHV